MEQLHGVVFSVDPAQGVGITLKGEYAGEDYWLPPHLAAFTSAPKGEYRLRNTGEVIVDPDYLTTWTVDPPSD